MAIDTNDAPAGYYAEAANSVGSCAPCAFYAGGVGGVGGCKLPVDPRPCVRRARRDGLDVVFKRKTGIPGQPRAVQALLCD